MDFYNPDLLRPGSLPPASAAPCWYINEQEAKSSFREKVTSTTASEYFWITKYNNGVIEGHLARHGLSSIFFYKPSRNLTYFIDYHDRKKIYFTFDGVGLFLVYSIIPGDPMLFILKNVDMENNSTGAVYNTHVNGEGNILAVGQNNSVKVGQMQWKGDMAHFKELLKKSNVPTGDIEDIARIVQQEEPDQMGNLPSKAVLWLNKMVKKATDGIWHITIHTAGALLAEYISSYYGIGGKI